MIGKSHRKSASGTGLAHGLFLSKPAHLIPIVNTDSRPHSVNISGLLYLRRIRLRIKRQRDSMGCFTSLFYSGQASAPSTVGISARPINEVSTDNRRHNFAGQRRAVEWAVC